MKLKRKLVVALAATSLLAGPIIFNVGKLSTAYATVQTQRLLSLGASLSEQEIAETKALLGASNIAVDKTILIDGNTVNQYLQDGSNASTGVYSSALIEQLPEGSGVMVQIITPNNIQIVKPVTFQNAAITSGATDVLIKIATVKPVTGEGALTGVYALLEKSGVQIDRQSIVVAEKEIKIIEQAKQEATITDNEINTLITEIKISVTNLVSTGRAVDANEVVRQVLANHSTIKLDDTTIGVLAQLATDYAQTTAAKNAETVKQLDNSINVSTDRPYAVDLNQYGGQATFVREGMNIPTDINLSLTNGTVSFNGGKASAPITVESIDTIEITATGTDGNYRPIKVNTKIRVGDISGEFNQDIRGDMYLFINRDNKLALLTPNYAGNDEQSSMLEWVVGEPIAAEEPVIDAPYAVDLSLIANNETFSLNGVNIPNNIVISKENGNVTLENYYENKPMGDIVFKTVPTKDIRVFSKDVPEEIRTVHVNTAIEVTNYDGLGTHMMYLFVNRNNEIALATPNYAGNVPDDQQDVMLEYTLGRLDTTANPTTFDTPYAVDVEKLKNTAEFKHQGNDVLVTIDKEMKKIYFTNTGYDSISADVSFETIPTKTVKTVNFDGNDQREVKVNTVLRLSNIQGNAPVNYEEELYLFTNAQGGISLLTSNYGKLTDPTLMVEYIEQ